MGDPAVSFFCEKAFGIKTGAFGHDVGALHFRLSRAWL
jgi:hypothetical protein